MQLDSLCIGRELGQEMKRPAVTKVSRSINFVWGQCLWPNGHRYEFGAVAELQGLDLGTEFGTWTGPEQLFARSYFGLAAAPI